MSKENITQRLQRVEILLTALGVDYDIVDEQNKELIIAVASDTWLGVGASTYSVGQVDTLYRGNNLLACVGTLAKLLSTEDVSHG